MTDLPDDAPMPTEPSPEDIARWTAAIEQIMADNPDWTEEQANAGLVWAVTDAAIREQVRELDADRANVALWTSVIRALQAAHPEWTEAQCNENLLNLLFWVRDHPGEDFIL